MQYRFRFVWNKTTHPARHARKLVGLALVSEEESTKGHFRTVWLDAKLLLKLTGLSAVVLWFAAAGGLYFWAQRSPFNRVGYLDLACPWRWSRISDLRGQGYIASGIDSLRLRKIQQGLFEIRQGLARHPNAATARFALAKIYARYGYYAGVRDIMLPQFAWPVPREFLHVFLELAAQNDDHGTMLTVCDQALTRETLSPSERSWLLERKAVALYALERYAETLTVLDLAGRDRSLEWRRMHVLALCGAGHTADALMEIRAWPTGVTQEFRLQMLAATYRRAGRLEEMAESYRELQKLHPTEPEPWIETIGAFARSGAHNTAQKELQDYLRRFDSLPGAIPRVSRVCAEIGAADLVALCLAHAEELGSPLWSMLADQVVAHLSNGDSNAAEIAFKRLADEERRVRERPSSLQTDIAKGRAAIPNRIPQGTSSLQDWLRSLLDAVVLPVHEPAIAHCGVLTNRNLSLQYYETSALVLAKFGHWHAAAAVARTGQMRFPGSTQLTRWSTTAAKKIAELPPAQPAVPAMQIRLPSSKPPGPAKSVLVAPRGSRYIDMTQAEFIAGLDNATQRGSWAETMDMIHGVNKAAPPWLNNIEVDLAWREVRIAYEQDDRPQLLLLIGQRVRTQKGELARAMEFARRYRERGDVGTARLIAGRILQEVPGYVAAKDFFLETTETPKVSPATVKVK